MNIPFVVRNNCVRPNSPPHFSNHNPLAAKLADRTNGKKEILLLEEQVIVPDLGRVSRVAPRFQALGTSRDA